MVFTNHKVAGAIGLVLCVLAAAVSTASTGSGPEQQLRTILETHLRNGDYPGGAAALHIPGEADYIVAVGTSDPTKEGGGPPLNPDQPLNIGSITKTFVAVVVLQLAQSGDIDLDESIAKWFPDLPNADQITVRQLLQHTSGMNDYLQSETVLGDATRSWTPRELIQVALGMGALGKPGGSYHYTNTTYVMLGMIIEEVTGRAWYEEVRSRITWPLGMTLTAYAGEPAPPVMGPGYRRIGGRFVEATKAWHPTVGGAAGGMISTPSDLLRFILALREGQLLDAQRMAEMKHFVPADPYGYIVHDYGLGYERYILNDLTIEGHLGTGGANAAFVGFDPVSRIAIAVQINAAQPGLPGLIAGEVLAALTGRDMSPPLMPTASVSFSYLPASQLVKPPVPEAEDLGIQISTLETEIAYPTSYAGGRTLITHALRYQRLMIAYENRSRELGELVENANVVAYGLTWYQQLNEKWSLLTILTPGLASDFESDISFDDAVLEVALVGIYSLNDRLSLGFGGGYNPRLGQHYPMPVLAMRWDNGVNMKLEAILPISLQYGYRLSPRIDLGFDVTLEGNSYHGDPGKYDVDNPQMRYSLGKAGPSITLHLQPWLHLTLQGGIAFGRRFEFYDGLDEQASYDLDPVGHFTGGLRLGQ